MTVVKKWFVCSVCRDARAVLTRPGGEDSPHLITGLCGACAARLVAAYGEKAIKGFS